MTSYPREPVKLNVTLAYETVGDFEEHFAADVGDGTLFLRSPAPKLVGTPVRVFLHLRDGALVLAGGGQVLWSYEPRYVPQGRSAGMGMTFEPEDSMSQERIERLLKMHGAGQRAQRPGSLLLSALGMNFDGQQQKLTAHSDAKQPEINLPVATAELEEPQAPSASVDSTQDTQAADNLNPSPTKQKELEAASASIAPAASETTQSDAQAKTGPPAISTAPQNPDPPAPAAEIDNDLDFVDADDFQLVNQSDAENKSSQIINGEASASDQAHGEQAPVDKLPDLPLAPTASVASASKQDAVTNSTSPGATLVLPGLPQAPEIIQTKGQSQSATKDKIEGPAKISDPETTKETAVTAQPKQIAAPPAAETEKPPAVELQKVELQKAELQKVLAPEAELSDPGEHGAGPPPLRPKDRSEAGLPEDIDGLRIGEIDLSSAHGRLVKQGFRADGPPPDLQVFYWVLGGPLQRPWPAKTFSWPEQGTKRPLSDLPSVLDEFANWDQDDDDSDGKLNPWNEGDDDFASSSIEPSNGEEIEDAWQPPLRSIAASQAITQQKSADKVADAMPQPPLLASVQAAPASTTDLSEDAPEDEVFAPSAPSTQAAESPQEQDKAAQASDGEASQTDWSSSFAPVVSEKPTQSSAKKAHNDLAKTNPQTAAAAALIQTQSAAVIVTKPAPRDRLPYQAPAITTSAADAFDDEKTEPSPELIARLAASTAPRQSQDLDPAATADTNSPTTPTALSAGPPLSAQVGISLPNGKMRPLFSAQTRGPELFERSLNVPQGQRRLHLAFFQGEAELAENNTALGELVAEGEPKQFGGRLSFSLSVQLDDDAVLQVEVYDPNDKLVQNALIATLDSNEAGLQRVQQQAKTKAKKASGPRSSLRRWGSKLFGGRE